MGLNPARFSGVVSVLHESMFHAFQLHTSEIFPNFKSTQMLRKLIKVWIERKFKNCQKTYLKNN
jgi:hypothetical protein